MVPAMERLKAFGAILLLMLAWLAGLTLSVMATYAVWDWLAGR